MKTKHKIFLAKFAYYVVHALRAILGKSDACQVKKSEINYDLDISQGIDFSIFLLGCFEPKTSRALEKLIRPGFVVIDVGANIGAHTLNIARLVGSTGQVIACEPTDFAFLKLAKNIDLNPHLRSRVTALQCFLGPVAEHKVPKLIYSRWPLKGGPDLHQKHLGAKEVTTGAKPTSIDEIVKNLDLKRIDLVKLDVDGFECEVLAGAKSVLWKYKPVFVMELAPYVLNERGCSLKIILDIFSEYRYNLFDENCREKIPFDAEKLENLIGKDAGKNVIACPA
jgi:FkbM family methyltransferase